jgi:hypothetical protein
MIHAYEKDLPIIQVFMSKFLPVSGGEQSYFLMQTSEFDGFHFDCDAAELSNCFMELEKEGFTQSIKRIFQGDHFYRSDTKKCPRCKRYRQECYSDHLKGLGETVCNRCLDVILEQEKGE